MLITQLSQAMPEYTICQITKENIEDVFKLMQSNDYYYSKTQKHPVTMEECIEDITALPPKIEMEKKTYVAFYSQNQCMAVLDFVEGYPRKEVGYIGLLMLNQKAHGKGIAKHIFSKVCEVAKEVGFSKLELACYETNQIGFAFWSKMGFNEIRRSVRKVEDEDYVLISMEKSLILL